MRQAKARTPRTVLPCKVTATAIALVEKPIEIRAKIDGSGNLTERVLEYFMKHVKDKTPWLGITVTAVTPDGTRWYGRFEHGLNTGEYEFHDVRLSKGTKAPRAHKENA